MNQIINTNTITHDINNFKAVFSQDRKIIGLDVGKKTIGIAISDPISNCLLYTSPSPRDRTRSRMPSSA